MDAEESTSPQTTQNNVLNNLDDLQHQLPTNQPISEIPAEDDETTHISILTRRTNKLKLQGKFYRLGSLEYESYHKEETMVYFRKRNLRTV